jgi:hypothetical protein
MIYEAGMRNQGSCPKVISHFEDPLADVGIPQIRCGRRPFGFAQGKLSPARRIQAVMATQPLPEEPELVTVFETEDEPEALVVQGLLRSEGNIESVITGIDAPPDVLPGVGGIMIRVPVERAAAARTIIRDYRTFGDPEAATEEEDPGESSSN